MKPYDVGMLPAPHRPAARRLGLAAPVALAALLAACGAESVGTAATVGKLQQTQLESAKAQQRQLESQLGAAMQAAADARASEADR